jgi:putative transposase
MPTGAQTLKYRPDFPETFGSVEDARAFCGTFYRWYNHDHRHSGIGMHTPFDVHHGRAAAVHEARADTLSVAYASNPERFVRKRPEPPDLPGTAWINRPETNSTTPATT